jgi:serine/threonine protein kinase
MAFRPATFGKYVLLKRIAIGGMAEVFRAKAFGAEGFEKLAAVKRMLPHLSSDSQFVDMFINEAKLAANLNHANIVQIYDFGCIDNLYFISMEYVHGKDIADIIRILRDRNLSAPLELACHIFIEVLNGLDYAHRPST